MIHLSGGRRTSRPDDSWGTLGAPGRGSVHSFERVDAGEHRAPRVVRSREAVRTPRDYALERELVMWMNGGGVGSCAERKQGEKCGLGILTAAGRAGRRVRPHEDLAPSPVNGALDPSQPKDRVVGGGARCEGAKRGAQQLWMLYCVSGAGHTWCRCVRRPTVAVTAREWRESRLLLLLRR